MYTKKPLPLYLKYQNCRGGGLLARKKREKIFALRAVIFKNFLLRRGEFFYTS